MLSIFSKIINGDIPSHKIVEDQHCYAFLDINPLVEGHIVLEHGVWGVGNTIGALSAGTGCVEMAAAQA